MKTGRARARTQHAACYKKKYYEEEKGIFPLPPSLPPPPPPRCDSYQTFQPAGSQNLAQSGPSGGANCHCWHPCGVDVPVSATQGGPNLARSGPRGVACLLQTRRLPHWEWERERERCLASFFLSLLLFLLPSFLQSADGLPMA